MIIYGKTTLMDFTDYKGKCRRNRARKINVQNLFFPHFQSFAAVGTDVDVFAAGH